MKKLLIVTALAATLGTGALYLGAAAAAPTREASHEDTMMLADDAPMPPPEPGMPGQMHGPEDGLHGGRPGGMGQGMAGWIAMHHGEGAWHHHNPFALVYTAQDRDLAPADVQKIAEAFLLLHGNHSWKVIDVAQQDDKIAFSLSAGDNTVIAKFTMDRHTGRIERTA